jgi:hypothetical protein
MKETRWAGEISAPFYIAGVSHLEVHGEAGALFRSFIDVLRATADGAFVRNDFPVLMVTSESGRLPEEVEAVIARDVVEELAAVP